MPTRRPGVKSLYLPGEILEEILHECARQGRSRSWMIRKAWLLSAQAIANIPSTDEALKANE